MSNTLLLSVAVAFYTASTVLTVMRIRTTPNAVNYRSSSAHLLWGSVLGFVALGAHILSAVQTSFVDGALNFSLASMAVLVSGIVTGIFLLGGLAMPIRRLGILVFPITIVCLIFSLLWGGEVATATEPSISFNAHILISLSAYALLAIASIQALLYVYQERQIKKRMQATMLIALPPLQTMEMLLFRLVAYGFVFLSLALISGVIFSKEIFGHAFVFKHHTILAVLGWLVFAILLYKRYQHGLRGSQAVAWTIGGFLLIQLGYFGTKIVSESLALQ